MYGEPQAWEAWRPCACPRRAGVLRASVTAGCGGGWWWWCRPPLLESDWGRLVDGNERSEMSRSTRSDGLLKSHQARPSWALAHACTSSRKKKNQKRKRKRWLSHGCRLACFGLSPFSLRFLFWFLSYLYNNHSVLRLRILLSFSRKTISLRLRSVFSRELLIHLVELSCNLIQDLI